MNISTTIKREYFNAIIAGTKTIEYRACSPYWEKRIGGKKVPDYMTLICGQDVLTVRVRYVNKVTTPKDLRAVVITEECFAIYLDNLCIKTRPPLTLPSPAEGRGDKEAVRS